MESYSLRLVKCRWHALKVRDKEHDASDTLIAGHLDLISSAYSSTLTMVVSSPRYQIPPEFSSQLRYVGPLDTRSDAEVIASLTQACAVTSEKNIWCFWHNGIHGMPAWCQRNIISWCRINGPSWTVRVLDSDPKSPNCLFDYIPVSTIPEAIVQDAMTGPFAGQHTADFVRTAVTYQHGGVFLDVGILLLRRLDCICWDKLSDSKSPYNMAIPSINRTNIANHFVACRRHDPFILRWHNLMLHMWRGKTDCKGTVFLNPLFDFVQKNSDRTAIKPLGWDFQDPVVVTDYVGQIKALQRLCCLDKEDEEGVNCYKYWCTNVLVLNAQSENLAAEIYANRTGPHPWIMERLATPISTPSHSSSPDAIQDWKDGYNLTWRLLTQSNMMKVTSATGLTKTPHLGVLWNMPENEGKDCKEGTFAELLRYGAEWFEQTREEVDVLEDLRPVGREEKGLLEV